MEYTIISCNIRYDNPGDLKNSWKYRKNLLVKTLQNHQPDLIATQEGRFDQLYDFQKLLGDFEFADTHRSWIKQRMYPSFFFKKNKFELIKGQDLWLSNTPEIAGSISFNSAFPRLMTCMIVQIKESENKLLFVNTHLDHINQETRINQIQVLSNQLKNILTPETRLIIMGDFNDSPTGPVREILIRNFPQITDSWNLFNKIEESSHHAFNGEDQNGSRIDWILTDKSIQVINCFMDKSHESGKYPTDHFPIVCKIKL